MHKNKPSRVLSQKEMRSLALVHVQAYVNACHCQSRDDVLLAMSYWQKAGENVVEFIKSVHIHVVK
ncbi:MULTISPECIES: hypothetical protein [unclassified Pantoea]|uniref:hypothetical protein n=1 Tax=unclassified Pantoea TaxID=2630326 RepID=UPI0028ABB4B9|nr:hypothetical protein [Pantoea sp.]